MPVLLKTVTRTQGNNQALKDGTVKPRTCELEFVEVDPLIDAFRRMVRGLEFDVSEMAMTIKSARGHSYKACELALAQLASKRFPLEKITTHRFGLKDVDLAIKSVGGHGVPDVIHASLMPWL